VPPRGSPVPADRTAAASLPKLATDISGLGSRFASNSNLVNWLRSRGRPLTLKRLAARPHQEGLLGDVNE
jgi:hypothetical protein